MPYSLENISAYSFEVYKNSLLNSGITDLKEIKRSIGKLRMDFPSFIALCLLHHSYFCSVRFTAKSWDKKPTFIAKQLERFYEKIYPSINLFPEIIYLDLRRELLIRDSERLVSKFGLNSTVIIAQLLNKPLTELTPLSSAKNLSMNQLETLLFL